jgi:hypothetical protein
LDFTVSECEYALEQAELVVENKNYDEWARAAYVAIAVHNTNSKRPIKKVSELIGEPPAKKRENEKKQKRVESDNLDELRKLALDKGLQVNW